MKPKSRLFAFRADEATLKLLEMLAEKAGEAMSVLLRGWIRQAAEVAGLSPSSASDVAEGNGNGEIN